MATSWACSMKSFATGLSVRFLRVTMPIGTGAIGSFTGKVLTFEGLVGNLNAEAVTIVRKRPVARRLSRISAGALNTVERGYSSPARRKAFNATDPSTLSGGGKVQGSFKRSASVTLRRRTHVLREPATTTCVSS